MYRPSFWPGDQVLPSEPLENHRPGGEMWCRRLPEALVPAHEHVARPQEWLGGLPVESSSAACAVSSQCPRTLSVGCHLSGTSALSFQIVWELQMEPSVRAVYLVCRRFCF